jgi:RNA polymerase sigma-70 factor (ECF subfamily)
MANVPPIGGATAVDPADTAVGPSSRAASSRAANAAAERELVKRAQAGDTGAYEELVRTHQQRIFAVVGGILRRREDVEDVVQQVLIKVFVSLRRFDLRSTFSTWVYKVAVNECYDYLRKKRVRKLVYEADLSEEQVRQFEAFERGASGSHVAAPVDAGRRAEMKDIVNRLLDELGEEDRMMLVLKEVEGFSVEEIGNVLGINVNTVKVRLFRARGRLVDVYRRRMQEGRRAS